MVLLKFYFFQLFLYLIGRSTFIIFYYFKKKEKAIDSKNLFEINIRLFYPVFGIVMLGNILFLLNYFIPLKSRFVLVIILALISINFFHKPKILFDKSKYFNLFHFFVIPLILSLSSYDINFHYDSGFYHLNHQNWLSNSKIIIGMSNIFWPFGMGSIFEYISSFLWFDKSFILLHFLNLVFVWFFFSFCLYNLSPSSNKYLKYSSFFVLFFTFLDNFGFNGGRNGTFYIQGIGKQDSSLGILFYIISVLIIYLIIKKRFNYFEFLFLNISILFIFQTKVSGAVIYVLFFIYIYLSIKYNKTNLREVFASSIPVIILFSFWLIKSLINSGCFIFPLAITCIDLLPWYSTGSAEVYQSVTTSFSQSYQFGNSIFDWIETIMSVEIKKTVITNFSISFAFLILVKYFCFKNKSQTKRLTFISLFFIFLNLIFLVFFGPEERYSIGILMFISSYLALTVETERIQINVISYLIFIFSLVGIVRLDSYRNFHFTENVNISVPDITYVKYSNGWVYPETGDKCWINLFCTVEANILSESKFLNYRVYLKD